MPKQRFDFFLDPLRDEYREYKATHAYEVSIGPDL